MFSKTPGKQVLTIASQNYAKISFKRFFRNISYLFFMNFLQHFLCQIEDFLIVFSYSSRTGNNIILICNFLRYPILNSILSFQQSHHQSIIWEVDF